MSNESSPIRHRAETRQSGESIGQIPAPRFNPVKKLKEWLTVHLIDHPRRGVLVGAFLGTAGVFVGNRILMTTGLALFLGGFALDRYRNGPRK